MFHLDDIHLTQFKNYPSASYNFNERVVGICGMNGKGKTNLLDAIYYLSFTKSYFSKSDLFNNQFGSDGFRIEGSYTLPATTPIQKVICIYRLGSKKELYLNDVPYEKFSSHIGKFPCVMIAPDDVEIIAGGSEERRKFMDTILSQTDAYYLQELIIYNKVLLQRNSLLKQFAEQGSRDMQLLEVLNSQLIQPGKVIYEKRRQFTEKLVPRARKFYMQIANNDEVIDLKYESQLNTNDFKNLLEANVQKDIALQRTTAGIHRDDLITNLTGKPFKNIASQGQRKSLLFAIKLAEYEILKESKGFSPILLLDDVFEKLDDLRMNNLLHWVCGQNDGQVFITDTHEDRLSNTLRSLDVIPQIIELK
jgi:DNA replication and repair protein RecF